MMNVNSHFGTLTYLHIMTRSEIPISETYKVRTTATDTYSISFLAQFGS